MVRFRTPSEHSTDSIWLDLLSPVCSWLPLILPPQVGGNGAHYAVSTSTSTDCLDDEMASCIRTEPRNVSHECFHVNCAFTPRDFHNGDPDLSRISVDGSQPDDFNHLDIIPWTCYVTNLREGITCAVPILKRHTGLYPYFLGTGSFKGLNGGWKEVSHHIISI